MKMTKSQQGVYHVKSCITHKNNCNSGKKTIYNGFLKDFLVAAVVITANDYGVSQDMVSHKDLAEDEADPSKYQPWKPKLKSINI